MSPKCGLLTELKTFRLI